MAERSCYNERYSFDDPSKCASRATRYRRKLREQRTLRAPEQQLTVVQDDSSVEDPSVSDMDDMGESDFDSIFPIK